MKKEKISENYLERIPNARDGLKWETAEDGKVTLCIENKGLFNKIAQRLFKKPKISYVHLDENGSFVWQVMDGKRNIIEIGELVDEKFGEGAHPLYPRLAKFFKVLDSYGFIEWK